MAVRKRLLLVVVLGAAVVATAMLCRSRLERPSLLPSQAAQFERAIADKNLDLIEKRLSACSPAELSGYRLYVNTQDTAGNTVMHEAALAGRVALAQLLVKAGAKVDPRNKAGRTPLLAAVGVYSNPDGGLEEEVLKFEIYNERADIVRWLLGHGADVNARDKDGNTALSLAIRARERWKGISYKGTPAPVSPDYDRVTRILRDGGAS